MSSSLSNLWWATAGGRPSAPCLQGKNRAQVAVVGAGILGTSTALALAERDVDVVLVEAGRVGEGASSRPGGFVVPHFSVGSPNEVRARLGTVAESLIQLVGTSAQATFNLIDRLGIECEARQGGWYHPAHNERAMARVEAMVSQWRDAGFDGTVLDAAATTKRTGTIGYVGAWYAPTGGTLHPLRYCRGLADAACAAGSRLFEHSRVRAIEARRGGYQLVSDTGTLDAELVLVCTNGLSSELVPPMTASIVPLEVWQCATEPLPPQWLEGLFARGECLSDTRRNLFTYRVDPAGRLITGALNAVGVSDRGAAAAMARRLARELQLPDIPRIGYLWSGQSSLSAARLPASIAKIGGIISATACNARGIALSTVVGPVLAQIALGRADDCLPVITAAHAANAGLQARLSRFYPHVAPLLDWLDTRRRA